jgi:hypothetical protein
MTATPRGDRLPVVIKAKTRCGNIGPFAKKDGTACPGGVLNMCDSILPQDSAVRAVSLSLSDGVASGLIYIEQFGGKAESCSARNRPWLIAYKSSSRAAVLFRPTCKTWGCPACGVVNRNRWIARALAGTEQLRDEGRNVDFLTITSHEKLRGAASFRVFPIAWDRLRRRYARALSAGDPGAFLAVPERHQDGTLHTHALITGGLTKRWWKDNARECGLGYQSDVKEVVDLGVAGYVGKYLGKTLTEEWPKHKRRVNCSRAWPELPDMPTPEGWTFRKVPQNSPISVVAADLSQQGYDVLLASPESAWGWLDELGGT